MQAGIAMTMGMISGFTTHLCLGHNSTIILLTILGNTMADTPQDADGYYGEEDIADEELDLSFLDEKENDEQK